MPTGPNWPLPTPSYGPDPRRPRRSWFSKLITVLIPALLALPYMPESVRTILPAAWRAHIPRAQLIWDGIGRGRRVLSAADSAKVIESSAMAAGLSLDAPALEGPGEAVQTKPAHVSKISHSPRAARRIVQPPPEEVGEPEGMQYQPDHAVSMIPMRIKTEIRLASAADREGAEAEAATPPNRDWPMLCAKVVDESGAAVGGALVKLDSARLSVFTDSKGRFCVACPPGRCTVRVDAPGSGHATRTVTLKQGTFEMQIWLAQAP